MGVLTAVRTRCGTRQYYANSWIEGAVDFVRVTGHPHIAVKLTLCIPARRAPYASDLDLNQIFGRQASSVAFAFAFAVDEEDVLTFLIDTRRTVRLAQDMDHSLDHQRKLYTTRLCCPRSRLAGAGARDGLARVARVARASVERGRGSMGGV